MNTGQWKDGYWNGPLVNGYPATYFDENNRFSYPWESKSDKWYNCHQCRKQLNENEVVWATEDENRYPYCTECLQVTKIS